MAAIYPEENPCVDHYQNSFIGLANDITSYLKFLSDFGYKGVDCSDETRRIIHSWDLSTVFLDMVVCKNCKLAEHRKRTINGMGDSCADLMIIGGMPEPEDARTGTPYSGKEGELLDRIISAMSLNRESVYITPAVKCCAPEAPESVKHKIKACKTHLFKEIGFVNPKIICTFGNLASGALLGVPLPIQRLRGRFHTYQGIQVMPTYSLSHLLTHPEDKRATWEDIKLVMRQYSPGG
jgi:uracil-DNA glycosylase